MRAMTCPKCGSVMIGRWEASVDRIRFRCVCSYTCDARPDDAMSDDLRIQIARLCGQLSPARAPTHDARDGMDNDTLSFCLAATLRDLGRAGKIASDWLPGMLVDFVKDQRKRHPRSVKAYPRRIESRGDNPSFLGQVDGEIIVGPAIYDPATLGCLLSLVREAHGDPGMGTLFDTLRGRWRVYRAGPSDFVGDGATEAHALLSALRAALPAGGGIG